MITKSILAERVRRILQGGFPSDRDRIRDEDVMAAIGPAVSKAIKAEALNMSFNFDGGSTVDGSVVATYSGIPLTRGQGMSATAQLPVTPMYMPENMGVFSIFPTGEPENEFIPVPTGMYNIWKKHRLVSPIHRKLYTWDSGKVTIHDDLIGAGVNSVDMKLCVVDVSSAGDNDPLPIPADMEAGVVDDIVQLLVGPRTHRAEDFQPSPAKDE